MTQGGQSWAESAIHRNIRTGWSSWLDPAAASRRWPRSSSSTPQTIRNWLDEADGPVERDDSKELRKLRRELARIKEERDILAKATAWFAKETTRTPSRSSSS